MVDETQILIQRAGDGETAAIGQLLERHLPALRAYVRLRSSARVRRRDEDSDIVQSVCGELLQNLQGFQYSGEAAFRHWLFTAALRKLVEKDRYWSAEKRNADRLLTAAEMTCSEDDPLSRIYANLATPSQLCAGRETLVQLEGALDKLPEDHREIVLMSRLIGLSHKEIATRLGRTESSVRTVLCRALGRLARILGT